MTEGGVKGMTVFDTNDQVDAPDRLEKLTLADQVADQILEQIYSRGLAPGTPLPSEGDLSRLFGVSRLVVREAVRTLVAKEVVDSGQGRPAKVRTPSSKVLTQLFEFHIRQKTFDQSQLVGTRKLLESQIAADAAARVSSTGESCDTLFAALENMAKAANEVDGFLKADDAFHSELARLAENPIMTLMLDGIHSLMEESRMLSHRGNEAKAEGQEIAIREHRAVAEAVQAGDPIAARIAMEKLVSRTLENVQAAMRIAEEPAK